MRRAYKPCRVVILASLSGKHRQTSIPRTGFGARRHADRWLAKGADWVTVCVYSASTGALIERKRYERAKP